MVAEKKGRILLVDDEAIIRQIAECMFEELGYNVSIFDNGADAVSYYQEASNEVDIVIVDMDMPGMNGHETFLALKKINPTVKAFLGTGYSIDPQTQRVLDDGVLGILQKPFRLEDLADTLQAVTA